MDSERWLWPSKLLLPPLLSVSEAAVLVVNSHLVSDGVDLGACVKERFNLRTLLPQRDEQNRQN